VAWQYAREKNREGAPATAALPAVGAKGALAAGPLLVSGGGVVARQAAVPIQRAALAAVRAALRLERKNSALNAWSSRTKRTQEGGIWPCCPSATAPAELFYARHS
jgi:hypothetical protein